MAKSNIRFDADQFAILNLLFSTFVTVLNDEFPNLKPRMIDRLEVYLRDPKNAESVAILREAIHRLEGLR
jgi:hypothetical protein